MERYDTEEGYCRMLGHYLPFSYCRSLKEGLPCHKIVDCWFERLPIKEFIAEHYSEDDLEKALTPPQPKMASILSLIEKAKGRQ